VAAGEQEGVQHLGERLPPNTQEGVQFLLHEIAIDRYFKTHKIAAVMPLYQAPH
jgi:hypothetical protein